MQAREIYQSMMKSYGKRAMNNYFIIACYLLLLSACAPTYQTYKAAPLDTQEATTTYHTRTIDAAALKNGLQKQGFATPTWPKSTWDLESLVAVGEFYSLDLQIESAKVSVAEAAEITAGQKLNPEINLSSEHHSEHDGGISPWTLGVLFSWVYQDPKKHQTRVAYAQAVTEMTKLNVAQVKWQIRDRIVDSYLNTLVAIHQRQFITDEITLLESALTILERSFSLGQISEFEVSSTRLALQQANLSLNNIEQAQTEARTQLALAVGLPADALLTVHLDEHSFSQLPDINVANLSLDYLQAHAVKERPDLKKALAEYWVAEADLHKEIAKQSPDFTFSPGFIFDQNDNIWALASNFILPINDVYSGPIAEAKARRALKGKEILALQTSLLQHVHQAHIMYKSALKSLAYSDTLLDTATEQQKSLQRQYKLGFTDSLKLIWQQRESLYIQRARYLLEVSAWREFARLEDAAMTRLNK